MNYLSLLKKLSIGLFLFLGMLATLSLNNLKFSFDFSQFFPEEDPDLAFYNDFVSEFGTDDNFLLIAIENDSSVFDAGFLERFHTFSLESRKFKYVTGSTSLTTVNYPLKTTFGYTTLPVIHKETPEKYQKDWAKIKEDSLFIGRLIDKNATSLVVALQTDDDLDYEQSEILLAAIRTELKNLQLENYHILGRAYFYEAIVEMQRSEVIKTTIIAAILVLIILFLVYRSVAIVSISITSIGLSLVLFLGVLSLLDRELNAMAAFYPVLMLIVGTSDVIHLIDSFLRKIKNGKERYKALLSSLSEVGLTTLLTSITTAIGFVTLLSSKLVSIQEFGINAAIGVIIAYITVILFTGALLITVPQKYLLSKKSNADSWSKTLLKVNTFTKKYPNPILVGALLFTAICIYGLSIISTNYEFKQSLPNGSAIATDFAFFQKEYTGFRPLELAITAKNSYKVTDFLVAKEIEKLTAYLKQLPSIGNVKSSNLPFKIIHKAHNLNKADFFTLPQNEKDFEKYKKDVKTLARKQFARFVNKEETRARINGKLQDVGTDSLQRVYNAIMAFTSTTLDTNAIAVRVTGKSMLLDKNATYIRSSLFEGLFYGLLVIGFIMVLVFRDLKMFLISLAPNVLPILFSGSILGFLGIPLEAALSVIFAIVFGIAVDDTIHFLGNYKLGISRGLNQEQALENTFIKTGRALVITTVILFFGFMVMLFSIHQPSITIGIIISVTLLAALVLDLLLLPVLIRKLIKK